MTFYKMDAAAEKRMANGVIPCTVRLLYRGDGGVTAFPCGDILLFELTSYRAADGGVVTRARLELCDAAGRYTDGSEAAFRRGLAVEVRYCFGDDGAAEFKRCVLYVGEKGFEEKQDGGGKTCAVELVDRSFFLGRMSVCGEWETPLVLDGCAVCDAENAEHSAVHILAARGGISADRVDCGGVTLPAPYAEATRSVWEELCELALTYRAHLECEGNRLLFVESEYGGGGAADSGFALYEDDMTRLHRFCEHENYANDVLVKYRRRTADGESEVRRVFAWSDSEIAKYGRVCAEKRGRYISGGTVGGKDFEQVFCERWLTELCAHGNIYYITTYLALVNARAGAFMDIRTGAARNAVRTRIDELTLCYKKDAAFETRFWLYGGE